ncbi:MAG: hypothetical protein IT330_04150 [Anaerolineae bacterium]|nr:hypothetical protein [Anaerolineae bacterium]
MSIEIPHLEAKLARHRAFWQRAETDRPLYGFWQGGYFPLEGLQGVMTSGYLKPENLVPEGFLSLYEARSVRTMLDAGDLLPAVTPFLGIPWTEAIAGCPIVVSLESGSIWAEPYTTKLSDLDGLEERALSPHNPWLRKLLEFQQVLKEELGGSIPFGTPIQRGPTDLLASIMGGTAMVYAFCEEPERMRRITRAVANVWIKVAQMQLALAPEFHGGYGCYRGLWAPGQVVTVQEDSSALLSPALYEDFVLPEDRRIYANFAYPLMHNHSAFLHITIDGVVTSEALAGYEMTIDPSPGPSISDLLPYMQRAQAKKPLIVFGTLSEADLRLIVATLPPAGLAIYTQVESPAQAARYANVIEGRA